MPKLRVIIADTDANYIERLQSALAGELFGHADLEVITDEGYFRELFSSPQDAEALVVSDSLYEPSLQRHSIHNIFLLTERDDAEAADRSAIGILKYASLKETLNTIVSESPGLRSSGNKRTCQIVVVSSASGGVGKTMAALGISACLAKNYRRVLYISASRLQAFRRVMKDQTPLTDPAVYAGLVRGSGSAYEQVKGSVRTERFSYLPALKAAALSLGLPISIYRDIAVGAKQSQEYDYVVVDTDTAFDEVNAGLLSLADKVIVMTRQTKAAAYATNLLVSNLSGVTEDKFSFVCGDYDSEKDNAYEVPDMRLKFSVNNYIEHMKGFDELGCEDYAKNVGVQKTAFLVM